MKYLITTIAAVVLVGCGESQPLKKLVAAPKRPIEDCAGLGDIEAVKKHIAAGTDVNTRGENGISPLLIAVIEGHLDVVELLISKGADVNIKDDKGMTPLQFAAFTNRRQIVQLLIKKNADVNLQIGGGQLTGEEKKIEGRTALNMAMSKKNNDIISLLRKHGGKTGAELKAEER